MKRPQGKIASTSKHSLVVTRKNQTTIFSHAMTCAMYGLGAGEPPYRVYYFSVPVGLVSLVASSITVMGHAATFKGERFGHIQVPRNMAPAKKFLDENDHYLGFDLPGSENMLQTMPDWLYFLSVVKDVHNQFSAEEWHNARHSVVV